MQQPTNPILIIVRGIPGSGKSYVAAALCHALGEDRVVLLDPDTTDYTSEVYQRHIAAQLAEGVDPTLHAYRYLRAQEVIKVNEQRIVEYKSWAERDNREISETQQQIEQIRLQLEALDQKRLLMKEAVETEREKMAEAQARFDEHKDKIDQARNVADFFHCQCGQSLQLGGIWPLDREQDLLSAAYGVE